MNVFHLSAECYPVAKVGGLADVVGTLPKYLCAAGINASVVIPYYDTRFVKENKFEPVFKSTVALASRTFKFSVLKETTGKLGYPLYLIYIKGLLDRPEVYCYPDEIEQFITYQLAFLEWTVKSETEVDVIHCHDHHSGLVPFLVSHSARYKALAGVPTICTIHNGQYQGWLGWDRFSYLPEVDLSKTGLLDWGSCINSLAASVKCCWKFTTVSPSYLEELSFNSNGLETLFGMEKQKGVGIINGIDTDVWNPATDTMIEANYAADAPDKNKLRNKKLLCKEFGLTSTKPLLAFIGRLVGEKGADLLPQIIRQTLSQQKGQFNILILGSGEKTVETELLALKTEFKKNYNVVIGYNELLSHRIYASADFLLMPSRVEPCGLNQLYALRYGTVPIVRNTGGLRDTVIDMRLVNGYGIRFDNATVEEACTAIERAAGLYKNTDRLQLLRKRMMGLDFSWHRSASQYIDVYTSLTPK